MKPDKKNVFETVFQPKIKKMSQWYSDKINDGIGKWLKATGTNE
jgi:hypothetical protein